MMVMVERLIYCYASITLEKLVVEQRIQRSIDLLPTFEARAVMD
jgi:hypothetical protein